MKHIDDKTLVGLGQRWTIGEYEYWARPAQTSVVKGQVLVMRRKVGKVAWTHPSQWLNRKR